MIPSLIERLAEGTLLAPLLGFAVGALVGLSPISLPAIPVVMSVLAPGQLDASGERQRMSILRASPAVAAFVAGMDGVIGLVGLTVVQVATFLTRASIALHLLAASLLALAGLRLLLGRASLCERARVLPPEPYEAFVFGLAFAVGGCPACGPIAIAVGTAAGLAAGPGVAFAILGAFLAGRTVVLLASAALGARLLPAGNAAVPWRRLDLVVAALFLVASLYYLYRVLHGDVTTRLPGEPGGPLP